MRPKIYLFGDSITEESFVDGGWGSSLANHFARTADVVLRGYSGYNTRWALRVIEKVFPPPEREGNVAAVTVFFGANDACIPDRSKALQHVPLDEYKQNLHLIVGFLKKRWPSAHIILITPPPIDEAARLELEAYNLNRQSDVNNPCGLPERTNEAAGSYAKQCLAVADESGVAGVDIWGKMQELPGWHKAYLSDGLHLAPKGNQIVFEEVVKRLTEKQVSLKTLPVDQPLITEINPDDPLSSFEDLN